MPYTSITTIPEYVKNYSETVQRQWMYVFNTVYAETKNDTRAMKASNSILKKRFKGNKAMEKNTRDDYFKHLVDSWLGNLKG